jgi:DNA-binding LacI/PurR family transcriptional regulator
MSVKVRTSEDLAKLVKVSSSTISRVFNNDPKISAPTRKRVLEVAKEHDFTPSRRKRSVSNRELRILLVTPAPDPDIPHIMDEAMSLFDGLSNAFADTKPVLEVMNSAELTEKMQSGHRIGDGVISVFYKLDFDICGKLKQAGIPYIHLNRTVSPYVSSNDFKGFLLLAEHLVKKGYKNPFYLGFTLHPRSEERKAAYIGAMSRTYGGKEPLIEEVPQPGFVTSDLIEAIVGRGADALMCFNDEMALRVYSACSAAGIRIPEDLAVTGYDDVPAATLSHPRLTTLKLPIYYVAQLAGRWLKDIIRDRDTPPISLEITGELIIGGST